MTKAMEGLTDAVRNILEINKIQGEIIKKLETEIELLKKDIELLKTKIKILESWIANSDIT